MLIKTVDIKRNKYTNRFFPLQGTAAAKVLLFFAQEIRNKGSKERKRTIEQLNVQWFSDELSTGLPSFSSTIMLQYPD